MKKSKYGGNKMKTIGLAYIFPMLYIPNDVYIDNELQYKSTNQKFKILYEIKKNMIKYGNNIRKEIQY